jgi:hypothetical protein
MNELHLDERTRIRAAMDRLLDGQPSSSNGSLTVVALAAEGLQIVRHHVRLRRWTIPAGAGSRWPAG